MALTAATYGIGLCLVESTALAQQWQPTRTGLEANENASEATTGLRRPVLSSAEQVGSGVVLRWQSTAPRGNRASAAEPSSQKIAVPVVSPVQTSSFTSHQNSADLTSPGSDNPLRQSTASTAVDNPVRAAAYQQEWPAAHGDQAPQWRSVNTRRTQEDAAPDGKLPAFPGNLQQAAPDPLGQPSVQDKLTPPQFNSPFGGAQQLQDSVPESNAPANDPRDQVEAAPAPPAARPQEQIDPPSFPPQLKKEDQSPADQSKERIDSPLALGSDKEPDQKKDDDLDELLRRARQAATPSCISQRDMLRGKPLSSINLDVSPKLSEGLSSMKSEQDDAAARKEFEKKSMLRDWTDYKGNLLASGRLVDLKLGNIVLDVGGSQKMIPLSRLSDVDMSYIADLWNLPFRCGTGFEPLDGRDFIASTVQWKASGACHNPLYFEQVQLERYGHEVGPVLQPLISSAHFFLSIPMLPYKMGINPPNECQYALGYFRPGNCAPYMIQPFPWSLRGGLAEAGAAVGAVALIP